jgi:hypothetical protein
VCGGMIELSNKNKSPGILNIVRSEVYTTRGL